MSRIRTLLGLPITAVVLVACLGGSSVPDAPGTQKSEPGAEDHDPCLAYRQWLLEEYAPLTCAEGPACVGLAPLDAIPACSDPMGAAYDTWRLTWIKHVYTPWKLRYNRAVQAFTMARTEDGTLSTSLGDRDRFVEETAIQEDERAAHAALLQVRPTTSNSSDYSSWLGGLILLLDELAFPRETQTTIPFSVDGREVCVDPFHFESRGGDCNVEPTLFLNPSERAMVELFRETMPSPTDDDHAFAAWVAEYYAYLASDSRDSFVYTRTHFQFPEGTGGGLADYELAFFALLRDVAPRAAGPADGFVWIGRYQALLAGTEFNDSDQQLRLELYERSRPNEIKGAQAYAAWLGADELGLGVAQLAEDSPAGARLRDVKPCAESTDAFLEMAATFESFADENPDQHLAFAAPCACGS